MRALVDRLVGDGRQSDVIDLGGTMSLNLHVVERDVVVRIHPPFVTSERLAALQQLRRELASSGLLVGEPVDIDGEAIVEVAGRLAEAERYVTSTKPAATWASYVWMFHAMGALHRPLHVSRCELPEPVVAT